MGLAKKAAVRSGLIFPGWGQWFLGERKMGLAIIVVETLLVVVLGVRIAVLTYRLILPTGNVMDVPVEPGELIGFMLSGFGKVHSAAYSGNWWLLILIVAIYAWSVWDAYSRGKKLELAGASEEANSGRQNEQGGKA